MIKMVKLNINNVSEKFISKTLILDCKKQITKIIPLIEDKKYSGFIINRNSKYFGIIDSKSIYKFSELNLPKNESVEKYIVKAPVINNKTPLSEILNYFINIKTNVLPYQSKNKINSLLTRQTLLKIILSLKIFKDIKVEEIMTFPIIGVGVDTKIAQAKKIILDHKIGRLIIIRNNKPVGILSLKDIVYEYTLNEKLPERKDKKYSSKDINIESIMQKNIKLINYNDSVSNAIQKILREQISSLVVIKNSKYIGLITISDIIKNIIIKDNITESKILLSGIDKKTKEYTEEIKEEIKEEIIKIEKINNYNILYFTLNIKRNNKFYQLYAKVNFDKLGIISLHVEEYLMDKALKKLLKLLNNEIRKDKDQLLTIRKIDNNE